MKKKLYGIAVIAIIGIAAAWNVNVNANKSKIILTDLTFANLEALAEGEWSSECPNGCTTTSGRCQCRGPHPFREAHW